MRNQATFRLARQALWRESWVFWSLLAEAWLVMLKQAYRGPASAELKPFAAEIATRALRYAGLVMRWDYHQARNPASSAWRRMHKIYRLAERDGFATQEVLINKRSTHCAREYAQVVMMGLIHPLSYRAQEIESIAQIIESYDPLPLPALVPQREVHTHVVDLSMPEGACILSGEYVQGRRLRYFALGPLIEYLKSLDHNPGEEADNGLTRQMASLIERGGISRNRPRTHRFGAGMGRDGNDSILAALAKPDADKGRPVLEPWMLRDESTEGMGFGAARSAGVAAWQPGGRELGSWQKVSGNCWRYAGYVKRMVSIWSARNGCRAIPNGWKSSSKRKCRMSRRKRPGRCSCR